MVAHGTYLAAWPSIASAGLNKMRRQHVHFAAGLPGDSGVISGMRSNAEVIIYLDLEAAVNDGIPFFVSDNNVLLTPGVGDTGSVPTRFALSILFEPCPHVFLIFVLLPKIYTGISSQ